MASLDGSRGIPPPPPPLPLDRSCYQCKGNRRIKVEEALSRSKSPCDRCEKATLALSVYMSQQHTQTNLQRDRETIRYDDEVSFSQILFSHRTPPWLTIYPKSTSAEWRIEICIDRQSSAISDAKISNRDLNDGFLYRDWRYGLSVPWSTGSTESLHWAREQLARCEESHIQCRQAQFVLPKRTLDLRPVPGNGNDIRLRESSPLETGRYVTLSHGWGKQHPPKTLRADVQASMKRIRLESLSKKFQQVVYFVRQIGIKFLWIDSLCIIQDDELDKLEQIPRMSEIYSNSFLTIAASRSTDSQGQLFSVKSPFEVGFRLDDAPQSVESNLMVRKAFLHQITEVPPMDTLATSDLHATFPLLKRAWVFQERILSPRMLYFGEHELHWECVTTASCECGIENIRNIKPSIQTLSIPERKGSEFFMPYYIAFARLVNYYSTLELSYEGDILLALQGIIRRLEDATGDENIAGLWKKSLGWSLCWTVESPSPRRRHAKVPTWSWASILTPINYQAYEVGEVDSTAIVTLTYSHSAPLESAVRLYRRVARGTLTRCDKCQFAFKYSLEGSILFSADISEFDGDTLYLVEIAPTAAGDERRERRERRHEFPCFVLQFVDQKQHNIFKRVGRVDLKPGIFTKIFDEALEKEDIYII